MGHQYLTMAYNILSKVWDKILLVFSSIYSILITSILLPILAFLGIERLWLIKLVIIALVIDLIWGTLSSIKLKKFLYSRFFIATLVKASIYGTLFSIMAVVESGFSPEFTWFSRLTCIVICISEMWSIFAHILIVKPNFPIIKILKKALTGEITKKLGGYKVDFSSLLKDDELCKVVETKICDNCGSCKIVKKDNIDI